MNRPTKISLFIITWICLTVCLSCSNKSQGLKPVKPEKAYYEAAQKALNNQNYMIAIEQLQQLEARYPFGELVENAHLNLIYAHYKNLEYDLAISEAKRFIRLHPEHDNVDFAYYMKGLSLYNLNDGFFSKFIPFRKAFQRDLSRAKKAFSSFQELAAYFPKSIYAKDGRQRMIYLRNLFAQQETIIARYYLERKAYIAAANRAQYVVENYPSSPSVKSALEIMMTSYQALSLDELTESSKKIMALNFPANSSQ